jgi:hypothetical protein
MTRRNCLKGDTVRYIFISPSGDRSSRQVGTRRVTDGAVVISLRWLVCSAGGKGVVTQTVSLRSFSKDTARLLPGRPQTNSLRYMRPHAKRRLNKLNRIRRRRGFQQFRYDVLVPVMRKLDHKLALGVRIPEGEARIIPRRNLRMANRTDNRLCPFEKLRTMTADACIVAGIVCDIRKVSHSFRVIGRNFVTRVAGLLVLFCSMRESGIVD